LSTPLVYLFHGDDEIAMRAAVDSLQSKLGDPASAEMNTTRFENNPSYDQIRNAAFAAPFLTNRRLVVLRGINKAFAAADARAKFSALLEELPTTTALVLIENPSVEPKNWLRKWVQAAGERAYTKDFVLPKGAALASWLRERAQAAGGDIQPQAAAALAQLLGSDKGAAEQELEKLLAYVGYTRAIEAADVAAISLPSGEQGDFFGLIDALSARNGARAMDALQALLQERDLIMLFFGLVGHFRLLLQSRELTDAGKGENEIVKQLGIHPFRAQKLAAQSRRFSVESLEAIYQRLLHLDEQIKTGEMEPELALELLVAGLSVPA
jgi:DNA polymerase-3 subunit delta